MLYGILEENQLCLLGVGHVVIIEVVLENSLNLIHVCQILIQTVSFRCTHLQVKVVRYSVLIANQMFSELNKHFQQENLTLMKSPNMMG